MSARKNKEHEKLEADVFRLGEELQALRAELHLLSQGLQLLTEIVEARLASRTPTCIAIAFEGAQPAMPLSLSVGQKVTATATEQDSSGTAVTPSAASLNWSVSDSTLATIETNPDGTATIEALATGSVTVTVVDEEYKLTGTDVLTITAAITPPPPTGGGTTTEPGVPTTIAIEFGTPA